MRRTWRLEAKAQAESWAARAPPAPHAIRSDARPGPGANARIQRPACEIRVDRIDPNHATLDAHHPLQLDPVELQRRMRVARELPTLAALDRSNQTMPRASKPLMSTMRWKGARQNPPWPGSSRWVPHLRARGPRPARPRTGPGDRCRAGGPVEFAEFVAFAQIGKCGVYAGVRQPRRRRRCLALQYCPP
jgi:hypothetical protein